MHVRTYIDVMTQKDDPGQPVTVAAAAKAAGAAWAALVPAQKEPYEAACAAAKRRYAGLKELPPAQRALAAAAAQLQVLRLIRHHCGTISKKGKKM